MQKFDNSYSRLPAVFYEPILSTNNFRPSLLAFNHDLAQELGLDLPYTDQELAEFFSATKFIPGSNPVAMVYAGHQFGHFSPQLGDGRAMLLGEFIAKNNQRYDIHLKGSGRTKYSRRGDGKSALGPAIREYLVSEGMHALGIPTTRSLAVVRTGELVYREEEQPGAVVTRIALGHIRVGSLEYFARRGDKENLKTLVDYTIDRLYPGKSYFEFWKEVALKQVALIPHWMSVGFIHGVMNTDNVSLSGETIDFGPCAFMDNFSYHRVFSSIDQYGRYAYSQQPQIVLWNLARLAECLMPLMDNLEESQKLFMNELEKLEEVVVKNFMERMGQKFGLKEFRPEDQDLIGQWFQFMESHELDFTLSYIDLERFLEKKETFTGIEKREGFISFVASLEKRFISENSLTTEAVERMKEVNPLMIPRNSHIQEVIEASQLGDDEKFFKLLERIKEPFKRLDTLTHFELAPKVEERVTRTFCGT